MTSLNLTVRVAQKLLPKYRAHLARSQDDYERMVEFDRRNGFIPEYCIHGVYQWVDYDCACHWCESGISWPNPLDQALNDARERVSRFRRLRAIADELDTLGSNRDLVEQVRDQALGLLYP